MKATTGNKQQNIEVAKSILTDLGLIGFDFSGYSDTNGTSVYFLYEGKKVRVSDHSVTNTDRVNNEIHFFFDSKCLSPNGMVIQDNQKRNRLFAEKFYNLV